MNRLMALGIIVAAAVLGGCVSPQRLLPEPIPQGVGVNLRARTDRGAELDRIAAAGVRVVRTDFSWAAVEKRKGEFDFSDYDRLTAELLDRGIRPYYVLGDASALYEQRSTTRRDGKDDAAVNSPQHPESVAAFARFAAAAARRYKGKPIIWEIWNEPNTAAWRPEPDVRQWIALATATCRAMREADPGVILVGPATSEFPWPFLEAVCRSGLLEELDALSVHPCRPDRNPEAVAEDYRRLRKLIVTYASGEKTRMPILSGACDLAAETRRAITPEDQARLVVRQQLFNRALGVPVSITSDPPSIPDPSPRYLALQTMTRQLRGYRLAHRLKTHPDDYVLLLKDDRGRGQLVAWTTAAPHEAIVAPGGFTARQVEARDLFGQPAPTAALVEAGRLKIRLTASPVYITPGD